jgi:integrase
MTLKDLDKIVAYLDTQSDNLVALRDKALILIGYYGAFRRSELVSLTWEQVRFEGKGIIIELARSKTDQIGEGASCIIPSGSRNRCPAQVLLDWRHKSNQYEGFVFRRFSGKGNLLQSGITDCHCNQIIKKLAIAANCERVEDMSAHSLRRGFATESARLGASLPSIQKHGRWKCTRTVLEYIEAGREFSDSAVNVLFRE